MDKIDMVMAGLQPAMLDRLAEDGYTRNRHDDLAMMAAVRKPAGRPEISRVRHHATRWPLLASGAVAVGAAAAVVVTVAWPAGRVASPGPSAAPETSATAPTARAILLASATVAARASAATGSYWYVKQRDYEPAWARNSGHLTKSQAMSFGARFAATEESWTGQHRTRTIVNKDLVFTFATAADKARWVAAGKPALSSEAGFSHRTATSNYSMTPHWGLGRYQLSMADFRRLPVSAGLLGKLLRKRWATEPDKAGAVGFKNASYAQYLVQWADALLTGPARPGTRAAIYRLLAAQPGLRLTTGITDPLGRIGVAVGDGGGDYLIIQSATARLLAYTTQPVRANSVIRPVSGVEVYEASGWATQFGVTP